MDLATSQAIFETIGEFDDAFTARCSGLPHWAAFSRGVLHWSPGNLLHKLSTLPPEMPAGASHPNLHALLIMMLKWHPDQRATASECLRATQFGDGEVTPPLKRQRPRSSVVDSVAEASTRVPLESECNRLPESINRTVDYRPRALHDGADLSCKARVADPLAAAAPSRPMLERPFRTPERPHSSCSRLDMCNGGCGQLGCLWRSRHGLDPICELCDAVPDGLCVYCRCIYPDCRGRRIRHGNFQGFCRKHKPAHPSLGDGEFLARTGPLPFPSGAGPTLKAVCAASLAFEVSMPDDADVCVWAAMHLLLPMPGCVPSASSWLQLILVHAIKWPQAVRRFIHHCSMKKVDADGNERELGVLDCISCLEATIDDLDGRPLKATHDVMSKGHMHSSTGLVSACRLLGLIEPLNGDADASSHVVKLGPRGSKYRRLQAPDDLKNYLKQVEVEIMKLRLTWPEPNSEEWLYFLEVTASLIKRVRVKKGPVGLTGGATEGGYIVSHFLRIILLTLEYSVSMDARTRNMETFRRGSPVAYDLLDLPAGVIPMDDMKYSTVGAYIPDKQRLCGAIDDHTCGELRRMLMFSPFMLSCNACMATRCATLKQEVPSATLRKWCGSEYTLHGRSFLKLVLGRETNDTYWDGFAPMPAQILFGNAAVDDPGEDAD